MNLIQQFREVFTNKGKTDAPYPITTERFIEWQKNRDDAIAVFLQESLTNLEKEVEGRILEEKADFVEFGHQYTKGKIGGLSDALTIIRKLKGE